MRARYPSPLWRRAGRGSLLAAALALCPAARAADVPVSTGAPGGLAPALTPQIVLLTFDDSVTVDSHALVQQVLTNHVNPNGHPVKATFFVSMDGRYDPAAIRQLRDAGHEIALHTMSHATSEASSLVRWRQEIAGERRALAALCDFPAEEIVGFRAPFLKPNDHTFRVLAEREFLYESSFPEYLSGLSTSPTNMIWPYTLDHGLKQVAPPERAPATNYPGLFELPLWAQFSNTTVVTVMDPPESFASNAVVALWQTNFLARYHGNRAPYTVALHATATSQWLSNPTHRAWRIGALNAFVRWALAQPDTWFITCRDLAAFMLAPVPAAAAGTAPPFLTTVRAPFPPASVRRCSFPDSHTLNVCGAIPPAAPNYANAYLDFAPLAGGTLALNVVSQDATYAWCAMTVSNDTPHRIYDWSAGFTVAGGTVQSLYDATWMQTGDQVEADARQYNRQVYPGTARLVTFRVLRSGGAVAFSDAALTASGLGPQAIRLGLERLQAPLRWRLTWEDHAHVYRVDRATNLLAALPWTAVTNDLCQPVFTDTHATDGKPRFYRVHGEVY